MKLNKELIGQLICCEWLDASINLRTKKEDLEDSDPIDALVENKCYGEFLKFDNHAIMIALNSSKKEVEIFTIPRGSITKIKILK